VDIQLQPTQPIQAVVPTKATRQKTTLTEAQKALRPRSIPGESFARTKAEILAEAENGISRTFDEEREAILKEFGSVMDWHMKHRLSRKARKEVRDLRKSLETVDLRRETIRLDCRFMVRWRELESFSKKGLRNLKLLAKAAGSRVVCMNPPNNRFTKKEAVDNLLLSFRLNGAWPSRYVFVTHKEWGDDILFPQESGQRCTAFWCGRNNLEVEALIAYNATDQQARAIYLIENGGKSNTAKDGFISGRSISPLHMVAKETIPRLLCHINDEDRRTVVQSLRREVRGGKLAPMKEDPVPPFMRQDAAWAFGYAYMMGNETMRVYEGSLPLRDLNVLNISEVADHPEAGPDALTHTTALLLAFYASFYEGIFNGNTAGLLPGIKSGLTPAELGQVLKGVCTPENVLSGGDEHHTLLSWVHKMVEETQPSVKGRLTLLPPAYLVERHFLLPLHLLARINGISSVVEGIGRMVGSMKPSMNGTDAIGAILSSPVNERSLSTLVGLMARRMNTGGGLALKTPDGGFLHSSLYRGAA